MESVRRSCCKRWVTVPAVLAILIALLVIALRWETWSIARRISAIDGVVGLRLDHYDGAFDGTAWLENGGRIHFTSLGREDVDSPDIQLFGIDDWALVSAPCDRVGQVWQSRQGIAFGIATGPSAQGRLLTTRGTTSFRELVEHYPEIRARVMRWPTDPNRSDVIVRTSESHFDRYWRTTWDGFDSWSIGPARRIGWLRAVRDYDCNVPEGALPASPQPG